VCAGGAGLTTYRELCSLANEIGQPPLYCLVLLCVAVISLTCAALYILYVCVCAGGAGLTTYRELCSLANEMGQPDLIYRYIRIAAAFS
jgi:hypothetical protein